MKLTTLQRRVLGFLATVDSATPAQVALAAGWPFPDAAVAAMRPIIEAGHALDISDDARRCLYRITLQGRQAIAPPLVRVAWKDGQSGALKTETAGALRVRLDIEMGPGTHWVVPT